MTHIMRQFGRLQQRKKKISWFMVTSHVLLLRINQLQVKALTIHRHKSNYFFFFQNQFSFVVIRLWQIKSTVFFLFILVLPTTFDFWLLFFHIRRLSLHWSSIYYFRHIPECHLIEIIKWTTKNCKVEVAIQMPKLRCWFRECS